MDSMGSARHQSPAFQLRETSYHGIRPVASEAKVASGSPLLSAVIVNYRQWPETLALVRQLAVSSLARNGSIEAVIVDNHSPAHTAIRRLRRRSGIALRRWNRNQGFARAVNEGCRLSRGRWILLLNPDVAVHGQFLSAALEEVQRLLTRDPRVGVVGFRLRHGDGSEQLSSGSFPTLASTLIRILVPRARRKYQSPGVDQSRPVAWVTGCCMLVRKECLDQLGGFDDKFFLYYEDVDFCRRAWAAGWSVWYQAFPCVVHHRPLHGRRVSAPLRIFTRHALLTYAAKHWPKWQFLSMTTIVRLEALFRQAVADWRRDARSVAGFKELGRICQDIAAGRTRKARRRLDRIVRDEELHGAA
jgi:N-acetylglucosaminyl-diphospho-decaprenol L-rhamnosyltransferase